MVDRKLRGFVILKAVRNKGISLKLFAQNGTRYVVMISRYFFGFPYRHKQYEFSSLQQAERYYQKIIPKVRNEDGGGAILR